MAPSRTTRQSARTAHGDPNREEEGYVEEVLSEESPRPTHSQHSQSHGRNPPNQQEGQNPLNRHGGRKTHNHQEAPLNIDLTNFDPHQVDFLLNVAANLKPQTKVEVPQRTKAKGDKLVEDEAHSGTNFVPRCENQLAQSSPDLAHLKRPVIPVMEEIIMTMQPRKITRNKEI